MDVIEIKIPFTEEELDKYFDAIEDYIFIVNVDESEYQGKALLNYIYNTSMQCDMKIKDYNENISNLLIEYIQTDKLLSIPALNILWIDILKEIRISFDIGIRFGSLQNLLFLSKINTLIW